MEIFNNAYPAYAGNWTVTSVDERVEKIVWQMIEGRDPLADKRTCVLPATGTKFFKETYKVVGVLWSTAVGKIEAMAAFPTIGVSYSKNVTTSLIPVTSCLDLLVLRITENKPSNGRDGAENTM